MQGVLDELPGLIGKSITPLRGESSLTFEVDGDIYRFATTEWYAEQFAKEAQLLEGIRGRLPLLTPVLKEFSYDPVYMVEEKIPGVSFTTDMFIKLEPSIQRAVVDKLADFLAALHAQNSRKYPLADNKHGELILSRFDDYAQKFQTIHPLAVDFAQHTSAVLSEVTAKMNRSVALLHGDFVLSNCLFDIKTTEPIGVVDFTASWIGDVNWDFTLIRGGLGKSNFSLLMRLYEERSGNKLDPVVIDCYRRTQLCHFLHWIDHRADGRLSTCHVSRPGTWRKLAKSALRARSHSPRHRPGELWVCDGRCPRQGGPSNPFRPSKSCKSSCLRPHEPFRAYVVKFIEKIDENIGERFVRLCFPKLAGYEPRRGPLLQLRSELGIAQHLAYPLHQARDVAAMRYRVLAVGQESLNLVRWIERGNDGPAAQGLANDRVGQVVIP
jgi:aminoglycoside phosphotransferase (APT) family kinase protein